MAPEASVLPTTLTAPFPWFGGKSRVSRLVWERFGDVPNYVEPFAGSMAVLLGRPHAAKVETVNDKDALLCNFWRAIAFDPEATAGWANWPVNESDLHARHAWLVQQKAELKALLEGNPHYFDAKLAGWWVWGINSWIGDNWCCGKGPWNVVEGRLARGNSAAGISRKRIELGNNGKGINRTIGRPDRGAYSLHLFESLSTRLRDVRVACSEWDCVLGNLVTAGHGLTAVLLDPPYDGELRNMNYATDQLGISKRVRDWAIANGQNPLLRIALCGFEGEHVMPADWECVEWKTRGGYGSQGTGLGRENASKERVWFSPACLKPARSQQSTFAF